MDQAKHEKLRLKQEALNQQSQQALEAKQASDKRRKHLFFMIGGGLVIIALLAVGINAMIPGKYDAFAKCLTDSGAIMYGAIEWCHYTQDQAGMFGKSFKYAPYRDYRDADITIRKTPTWVINGQAYENVQSFETLSSLTGCKI